MLLGNFKRVLRSVIHSLGYEITPLGKVSANSTPHDMFTFLIALKKLGLACPYVLDAGAHQGWFSRMMTEVYPNTKLYLVEPLQEMETYMTEFCKKNENAVYYPFGLGRQKNTGYITKSSSLAGSSVLDEPKDDLIRQKIQYPIEIWSIDALISEKNMAIPTLIKMDIEGSELEALKGAELVMGKTEVFIIETALYNFRDYRPDLHDIVHFMYTRNYLVYDVLEYHRRPYDGALGMCDLAFARKDGFLRKSHEW